MLYAQWGRTTVCHRVRHQGKARAVEKSLHHEWFQEHEKSARICERWLHQKFKFRGAFPQSWKHFFTFTVPQSSPAGCSRMMYCRTNLVLRSMFHLFTSYLYCPQNAVYMNLNTSPRTITTHKTSSDIFTVFKKYQSHACLYRVRTTLPSFSFEQLRTLAWKNVLSATRAAAARKTVRQHG